MHGASISRHSSLGHAAQLPRGGEYALTVAGPLAIGAVLGANGVRGAGQVGALDVAHAAATLPIILVGVAAAMIPALYIATSLSGAAPPAHAMGAALWRAFRACSVALLGLLMPVAFLLATSESRSAAALVGALVITVGVFAGLRVLLSDLYGDAREPVTVRLVFAVWSAVALAIGASMYGQFLVG